MEAEGRAIYIYLFRVPGWVRCSGVRRPEVGVFMFFSFVGLCSFACYLYAHVGWLNEDFTKRYLIFMRCWVWEDYGVKYH